jgi:hypothetical protein
MLFGQNGISNEILIIGLIGLGLYAHHNEICLANNITILIILFFLFVENRRIEGLERHELLEHCDCSIACPCGDRPEVRQNRCHCAI